MKIQPRRYRSAMRRHLCVVLTGSAVDLVERWRRTWDPVMAAVVPAHLTVTYPEEYDDEGLLLHRAQRHVSSTRPFRLRLEAVFATDGGRGGVFLSVDDLDGGWADLRRRLLTPPMTPVDFPPHVTLAHPRTSSRGGECLVALAGRHVAADVVAREVLFTETTADSFTVLRRFPMAGGGSR